MFLFILVLHKMLPRWHQQFSEILFEGLHLKSVIVIKHLIVAYEKFGKYWEGKNNGAWGSKALEIGIHSHNLKILVILLITAFLKPETSDFTLMLLAEQVSSTYFVIFFWICRSNCNWYSLKRSKRWRHISWSASNPCWENAVTIFLSRTTDLFNTNIC